MTEGGEGRLLHSLVDHCTGWERWENGSSQCFEALYFPQSSIGSDRRIASLTGEQGEQGEAERVGDFNLSNALLTQTST